MREKFWSMRRFGFLLAGMLALTMICGSATAWAQDDEDEDLPADTKFFRKLFKEFGLQREGPGVEFRERAPLVVPPSRDLPLPQSEASVTSNPAWPNDPDVQKRNVTVSTPAQRAKLRGAAEAMEEEGRALRPNELNIGTGPTSTGSVQSPRDSARPMQPSQLGTKGFLDFFTNKSSSQETAEFTNEPPRTNLTAPPVGYQTPSTAQPYGLGPARSEPAKPTNLWDRAAGQN
jgi:hypothetical protein